MRISDWSSDVCSSDLIRAAVILFPAHHSRATLRACVVEELTQIMGLANDSTIVADSIFNDRSPFTELTANDRLLLRILYDRRIPKIGRASCRERVCQYV